MDGSAPLEDVSRPRIWRPLHAALALLMTRSEAFADEVAVDPDAGRCIELGLILRITYKEKQNGVKLPILKSSKDAWLELQCSGLWDCCRPPKERTRFNRLYASSWKIRPGTGLTTGSLG